MSAPIAYLKGEFIPYSEAVLPVYDASVVLGATVTETTRTFNGKPFKLGEHVDRLYRSMKYARFKIQISPKEMIDITMKVIDHNLALLPTGKELGVIHFVTAGTFSIYAGTSAGTVEMMPTVCVHTFELPLYLWADGVRNGVHAVTPSNRHIPPQCIDPKMKNRSRMHYWLAEKEARMVDPKAAVLLLDLEGNVTEFSGGNILIVQNGTIVSPTLRNSLPGLSRQTVIELADKLGIPFEERDFQVFDVCNADEAFESSTPFCLRPVTRINNMTVGDGKPGPICGRLQKAWSELVGVDVVAQILGDVE